MTSTAVLDVDTVSRFAKIAAIDTYRRYAQYVDKDDLLSEIHVYMFGDGRRHIAKWSQDPEDGEYRVKRALYAVAKLYCENEKAARCGYHPDDVAWYSPGNLVDLIPLATDPEFDGHHAGDDGEGRGKGPANEGGNLLAMVMDVRRAVARVGTDPDQVAEFLGGDYPSAPGYHRRRRRAISNAHAQVLTRTTEVGE